MAADDSRVINPAGTVLLEDAPVSLDADNVAYISLGNGFRLYAGQDHELGTKDDLVKGFGRYPQSDASGAIVDPLNWRILDIRDGKAVLLASSQLDGAQFNINAGDGNDYAHSNLRAWLNSLGGVNSSGDTIGFYDRAFNADEKNRIVATSLNRQGGEPFGGVNPPFVGSSHLYSTPAIDVEDSVWVLSGEEAIEYFGPSEIWPNPSHDGSYFTNGTLVPTAYAHAHGVKINEGGNGPANVGFGDSWLRTPGANDGSEYYALFLSSLGNLNARRQVNRVYGVLPVITVSLEP